MSNRVFLNLIIFAAFAYAGIFIAPAILNHRVNEVTKSDDKEAAPFGEEEAGEPSEVNVPPMSPEDVAKYGQDVLEIQNEIIQLARGNAVEAKQAIKKTERLFAAYQHSRNGFASLPC